jgi:hypothetical protein
MRKPLRKNRPHVQPPGARDADRLVLRRLGGVVASLGLVGVLAGADCSDDPCRLDAPACVEKEKSGVGPYELCPSDDCGDDELCAQLGPQRPSECVIACDSDADCAEGSSCRTIQGSDRFCANPQFAPEYFQ